jgi:hypothetical protein
MLCCFFISCESKIGQQSINSENSSQNENHSRSILKGYFIDLVEESHHGPGEIKFQKLDSTYISLLLLNDEINGKELESIRGKLLKVYYSIEKSYVQEFNDTLVLEIFDSVKVIN